jgi:hypothetical protein
VAAPSLFGRLLLGGDVSEPGAIVARIAGFALLALGLACWPVTNTGGHYSSSHDQRATLTMLTYNALISGYLILLGVGGRWVGLLLWPAVGLHALLALLLARKFLKTVPIQSTKG